MLLSCKITIDYTIHLEVSIVHFKKLEEKEGFIEIIFEMYLT